MRRHNEHRVQMKIAGEGWKKAGAARLLGLGGALILVLAAVPDASLAQTATRGSCSVSQRQRAFSADQRSVLRRVGDLTTLHGVADLARLASIGYSIPPHQFVSFRGMGVAFLDPTTLASLLPGQDPEPWHPALLLYRPGPKAKDATDPRGPDFPYTLAGWAYIDFSYRWAQAPTSVPCLARSDWFVHERGIHPFADGGFIAVPPTENFHGQADRTDPPPPFVASQPGRAGVPHPRAWDTHIWLDGGAVPMPSMLNPGTLIPGIDPQVGVAFFYPPPPQ